MTEKTQNPNEFSLNGKFYSKKAITRTIAEFHDFGDFEIAESGGRYQIKVSNIRHADQTSLKNEFCNHCLGLMK